jgi:hypothetical protein
LNRPLSQFFHYLTPPVHTYWLPHRGGGASTNFWKNDFWKNDLVPFILGIQLNDKFYYNWLDCCNCFNLNWNANANHQSNSNWLKRFEIKFKWGLSILPKRTDLKLHLARLLLRQDLWQHRHCPVLRVEDLQTWSRFITSLALMFTP